jgi:hypothetical protein
MIMMDDYDGLGRWPWRDDLRNGHDRAMLIWPSVCDS